MSVCCKKCEKKIHPDNAALCMKLYGRETSEFYCYDCLSERENFPVEKLYDLVQYYRESGCMLFSPLPEEMNKNGGIL